MPLAASATGYVTSVPGGVVGEPEGLGVGVVGAARLGDATGGLTPPGADVPPLPKPPWHAASNNAMDANKTPRLRCAMLGVTKGFMLWFRPFAAARRQIH